MNTILKIRIALVVFLVVSVAFFAASGLTPAAIVVSSLGPMQQIYSGAGNGTTEPGSHIREHCTLWNATDRSKGILFFAQTATSPYSIYRAETLDGGLNWTTGVDTNLVSPSVASPEERNPVIRDFDKNGLFTGLFGTKQGVYGGGFTYNDVLFHAASTDLGASWSGEALVTFNAGAFPGHTGLNGFVEVFKTSEGTLRGYTAMNNITGNPLSATHIVESTDGGATWTDLGNIVLGGINNVVGANGPVFSFVDTDDGQTKLGWFLFGESAYRGVHLMISTNEGLSWTAHGALSLLDGTIRSGDANFLSDSLVRLFYHRNVGTIPSDRQLWYQDFALSGMTNIQPNNLYFESQQEIIPEPASAVVVSIGLWTLVGVSRWRALRRHARLRALEA